MNIQSFLLTLHNSRLRCGIIFVSVLRMKNEKIHFRDSMLFYFKKRKIASQISHVICDVYRQNSISDHSVRMWFEIFKCGYFSLEYDVRCRGSSSVKADLLKGAIADIPRYTVQNYLFIINFYNSSEAITHIKYSKYYSV